MSRHMHISSLIYTNNRLSEVHTIDRVLHIIRYECLASRVGHESNCYGCLELDSSVVNMVGKVPYTCNSLFSLVPTKLVNYALARLCIFYLVPVN